MKLLLICIIWSLLLLTLPVLTGCGGDEDSQEETPAAVETSSAPATTANPGAAATERQRFALTDIDGKVRYWSEFAGKPVVINFWATWCGPCRNEIPMLKKLYAEYHPQGVEIIGISIDDPRTIKNVPAFSEQLRIPWVVVYTDRNAPREFGLGRSIPMTVFIDAEGNETGRITGALPESEFRREFAKMVAASE